MITRLEACLWRTFFAQQPRRSCIARDFGFQAAGREDAGSVGLGLPARHQARAVREPARALRRRARRESAESPHLDVGFELGLVIQAALYAQAAAFLMMPSGLAFALLKLLPQFPELFGVV